LEDEVILWKAPQPGRPAEQEIIDGFDPQLYPGNGPYFATIKAIAVGFANIYGNGLQEIHFPKTVFDDLVGRGVILADTFYDPDESYYVPAARLTEFNEAMKQGRCFYEEP
jgi:hypothetical protein